MHRNLEPSNILLDQNNNIKICDFRCAVDFQNHDRRPIGLLEYQSPEMISGAPYDHKTDIWSLGVLLHRMLFDGDLPWRPDEDTAEQILSCNETEFKRHPNWYHVPTNARGLVLKLL